MSDKDYMLKRAEDEIAAAQAASHEAAVRSHYLLAGLYLDQAYGGAEEQTHMGRSKECVLEANA